MGEIGKDDLKEGKTALVTGGTVRLGLAISERLRAAGWKVITTSHRPDAGADITVDLSEPLGAAKLYSAALSLLGGNPPEALINNAALLSGDDAAVECLNFTTPQKLTILMAGRETRRGAVVNILDAQMDARDSERSAKYGESKRALKEYTVRSAAMFAETLRVNAVAPGPVLVPVGVREKAGETLIGRPDPEDVAAAVEFLLQARATTGVVLPVDGGMHILQERMGENE